MDPKLAFSHIPGGIRVANLKQSVEFWRAEKHDIGVVHRLKDDITMGPLRFRGGIELMRRLRDSLGDLEPVGLMLIWLAAVQEHPRHRRASLETIAKEFIDQKVRIEDFLPMPARAAA